MDEQPTYAGASCTIEDDKVACGPKKPVGQEQLRFVPREQPEDDPPAPEDEDSFLLDDDQRMQEVLATQTRFSRSLVARLIVALLPAAALVYLNVFVGRGFPVPEAVNPENYPFGFVAANLLLIVAAGLAAFPVAFGGIASLLRLRADGDALTSLAFFSAAGVSAALLADPEPVANHTVFLATAMAGVCIVFNLFGKLLITLRVKGSLSLLSKSSSSLRVAERVEDGDIYEALRREHNLPEAVLCCPVRAVRLDRVFEECYAPSPFDRSARWLAPLMLAAAIAAGVVYYLLRGDSTGALCVFALVCGMGAPVAGELAAALPMWRAAHTLGKKKAVLAGCGTVADFSDATAFAFDVESVFPHGTVQLSGIKTFTGSRVDGAIVDAASLACAAGGPLGDLFYDVLGSAAYLRPVDELETVEDKGLAGWVQNRRVQLGRRTLMRKYNIDTPSHDFEAKVLSEGDEPLYLSVSGELTALLMVRYIADPEVARALSRLQRLHVTLLVNSTDPNLTGPLLADKFDLKTRDIQALGAPLRAKLHTTAPGGRAKTGLAFFGGAAAYAAALTACIKLRGTLGVLNLMLVVSALLGSALLLLIAFTSPLKDVSVLQLLVYQAIWALPVLLIALLRKH